MCDMVQAGNDPIAPAKAIPYQAIKDNPNCMLAVTPSGGHLGWVSGPGAPLGTPRAFQLSCGYVIAWFAFHSLTHMSCPAAWFFLMTQADRFFLYIIHSGNLPSMQTNNKSTQQAPSFCESCEGVTTSSTNQAQLYRKFAMTMLITHMTVLSVYSSSVLTVLITCCNL